jgi:hypothetical protein
VAPAIDAIVQAKWRIAASKTGGGHAWGGHAWGGHGGGGHAGGGYGLKPIFYGTPHPLCYFRHFNRPSKETVSYNTLMKPAQIA